MADSNETTSAFSRDMERLSEIVTMLERNQVDLEEGVDLYKEACACVKRCREKLEQARNVLNDGGLLKKAEDFLGDGVKDSGDGLF